MNPMLTDIDKMFSEHTESECEPVTAKACAKTGVTTPSAEGVRWQQVVGTGESTVQTIVRGPDMASKDNLRVPKVNTDRLSKLACWILQNTGDGIERGEIVARFYGLERLYCHFYVDPCFGPKQRREHERKFRYAQPRVTMALKRLENRGLIRLIRHGKYVKRIRLTEEGETISNTLDNPDNSKKSNDT
ncbi:MAG: hypothetical protein CEE38_06120 [Planctomycetes bacterium B3_Pla]|nr:MAG: hypothetical protein CEE38_06120 [Planctomycetes bacterium B3_Pla]